ncbi:neutral zinc metallopeptidase [Microcella daejeonensis]|uniref:KPN_02809 family neutral zinc metallopeptidase n=1 Tax=Microcella daejeonensis TaxID=2994971 RepID=UPI00226F7FE9|nr:neutral zinc metallopeptidase [Microcella daejeonensis]WAB84322.1 neutral zinc metallopeptidase [Microcella daejeonensis]
MTFRDDADISSSRLRRRGRGRTTAIAGGGGIVGLIAVFLIAQLTGVDVSGLLGGGAAPAQQGGGTALEECTTGAEANASVDCRIAGAVVSLDDFWAESAGAIGVEYRAPEAYLFEGAVSTGCGEATSAVGPFYCPVDESVYLDTGFYDDLRTRFGAEGGPLAEMYVVAHEWGHHMQQLTGVLASAERGESGPQSDAVRIELQADCWGGAWAAAASATDDPDGRPLLEPITDEQVAQALDAAASIGDDRIQERTSGQVSPESWTHGSGEQRQAWFRAGFEGGVTACDTFAAETV